LADQLKEQDAQGKGDKNVSATLIRPISCSDCSEVRLLVNSLKAVTQYSSAVLFQVPRKKDMLKLSRDPCPGDIITRNIEIFPLKRF
jgi:hypothetical protein